MFTLMIVNLLLRSILLAPRINQENSFYKVNQLQIVVYSNLKT